MKGRARLLRCYPPVWRERYGDDLATYLDDMYAGRLPVRAAASLIAGGLRERVHLARTDRTDRSAAHRVRAGVLAVLAAWAAFVVAGSGFAKISEHFDSALPPGTHRVPDVAYAVVQGMATVSGLTVVGGLALAVPALLRFISSGGWPAIRRHVVRAATATAVTACVTVAVAAWAHQLSTVQRNGGNAGYAALFLVWAGMVAVTLALWTVAVIVTAQRVALPRRVLLAEAALAIAVTIGMLTMLVAAATWWAAMASSAPWFFGGAPGFTSAWSPPLVATLGLMVAALAAGGFGVIRIARAMRAA